MLNNHSLKYFENILDIFLNHKFKNYVEDYAMEGFNGFYTEGYHNIEIKDLIKYFKISLIYNNEISLLFEYDNPDNRDYEITTKRTFKENTKPKEILIILKELQESLDMYRRVFNTGSK